MALIRSIFVIILLAIPVVASVTFVAGSGATGGTGCTTNTIAGSGSCPLTPGVTPTPLNGAVIYFRPQQTASVTYVQDNNLFTMLQGPSIPFNSGFGLQGFAMFIKAGASPFLATGMATADSMVYGEYNGVGSFNLTPTLTDCIGGLLSGNTCTGTGTVASITFNMHEAGGIASCAFTQGGTNGGGTWQAPFNGTLRASYTASPSMVLVDKTSTAPGPITVSASLAVSSTYRAACIELRPVVDPQAAVSSTLLQTTPPGYGSLTGNAGCTVTGQFCDWNIATTTKGALEVFPFLDHSDFDDIQRFVLWLITCANPSGCNYVDAIDVAILPGPPCQGYVSDAQPESNSIDFPFVPSGAGGATHVTAMRSGANATSERQGYGFMEIMPPIGSRYAFDACNIVPVSTLQTSFNITTPILNSTNETVVQVLSGGAFPLNITLPYIGISIPLHQGFWLGLNISSTTPPTITGSGASNGAVGLAASFKLVPAFSQNQLINFNGGGKYLANTSTNKPVYLVGDDSFELPVALCYSDALQYLNDRAARGYNAVWWGIVDNVYSSHSPANCNGDKPFDSDPTGANDFTNFDTAYWAYIDKLIIAAAARGITIFFNPAFVGIDATQGWFNDFTGNGTGGCCSGTVWSNYGLFLGNRYKNYPNIIWLMGGDADILGNSSIRTNLGLLATAITSVDPNHLVTAEACRSCDGNPGNQSSITAYNGTIPSWLNLNWSYDIQAQITTANGCPLSYTQSPTILSLEGEMWYENEHSMTGANTRAEAYWATFAGCFLGTIFGNDLMWQMATGWQGQLGSIGSVGTQYLGKLMRSRNHWLMVPDSTNSILVGGISSGLTLSVAASALDGSTVIVYDQSGSTNPPQIAMGHFTGTVHAWWYNPSTAATTDLGTFTNSGTHTFTPSDTNDWVLVLDLNSLGLAAPGVSAAPPVTTVVGVIL